MSRWNLTAKEQAVLVYSDSSEKDLEPIVEVLGFLVDAERDRVAAELLAHPNFTDEAYQRAIVLLETHWWGESPIECNLGITALMKAYESRQ